eukprot:8775069-Pyramimonas_sp.AAC.2
MQIHPGHAVFERRKPALMDSLVQAFAMAPLFVHMEVLFWMGYRPALQARIAQEVARRVSQVRVCASSRDMLKSGVMYYKILTKT